MSRPGTFYGVGIGPGDPRLMTLRAAEVLREADRIFTVISPNAAASVSERAVRYLGPLKGELRVLQFSMSRERAARQAAVRQHAATICRDLEAGLDCAFATLGDALTYSTFGYVLEEVRRLLPEAPVEIVPGVNAFSALAARSGTILAKNGEMLRVIPAFEEEMADGLDFPSGSSTVLLKTYHSRVSLLNRLRQEADISLVYGERLGLEDEYLTTDPDDLAGRPEAYLSLMLIKKG